MGEWFETCHTCGHSGHYACVRFTAPCPSCGQDAEFYATCVYVKAVGSGNYFKSTVRSIACARCDA